MMIMFVIASVLLVSGYGYAQCTGDTDCDGITDAIENSITLLKYNDPDSDGDGLCDGNVEVDNAYGTCTGSEDKDVDGVVDDGETDPCNADTDGDLLCDGNVAVVDDDYVDNDINECFIGEDFHKGRPN